MVAIGAAGARDGERSSAVRFFYFFDRYKVFQSGRKLLPYMRGDGFFFSFRFFGFIFIVFAVLLLLLLCRRAVFCQFSFVHTRCIPGTAYEKKMRTLPTWSMYVLVRSACGRA